VKVKIDTDEWYPVYSVCDAPYAYGKEVEIPDEFYERYQAVMTEFNAVQDLISALVE